MLTILYVILFMLECGFSFKFYIYEWPKDIIDVYPNTSVELKSGGRGQGRNTIYKKHSYRENYDFGNQIVADMGLYDTFTFALYKVIYGRLLRDPSRTLKREEADAFFVPYDIGYNIIISKDTGRERSMVFQGCEAASQANALLKQELVKQRSWGYDHFLVFDLSNGHHMAESCLQFLETCANCTVLSIETLLYHTPFTEHMAFNKVPIAKKWRGVPFPAAIHWHVNMSTSPDSHKMPWSANRFKRSILSVFWGNAGVQNRFASKLRNIILSQCDEVKNHSLCLSYGSKGGRSNHNVADLLIYTNATFCFQPAGDAETRKGVFDSILLGCIPVVFSPLVMHRVNGWFFSAEDARATTLYISGKDLVSGNGKTMHVIDILRKIPKEKILRMQLAIEKLAPTLQYAVPPVPPTEVWRPPFRDAMAVILEKLDTSIAGYKRTGIVPRDDQYVPKNFMDAIYSGEN